MDGGNSVGIGYVQLDTTTAAGDGGIGLQFAHRSTAIENSPIICPASVCGSDTPIHDPATNGVWPTLIQPGVVGVIPNDAGDDGGDAGFTTVIGPLPTILGDAAAGPVHFGNERSRRPRAVPFTTVDPTTSAFGVLVQPLDASAQPNFNQWPGTPGAPGDLIAVPLSDIQLLSSWNSSTASAPTGFQAGQSYTFILVGDPVRRPDCPPGRRLGNPLYDGRGVPHSGLPERLHCEVALGTGLSRSSRARARG